MIPQSQFEKEMPVQCMAMCQNTQGFRCALKKIYIGVNGECQDFKPKEVKEVGSIGGDMVKNMIRKFEETN